MLIRPPRPADWNPLRPIPRSGYMVSDLAELRGPAQGVIGLPLWLDWSPFRPQYDLGDAQWRIKMYELVLRDARSEADLRELLHGDLLVEVWPDLHLPRFLKDAWEQEHSALRFRSCAVDRTA